MQLLDLRCTITLTLNLAVLLARHVQNTRHNDLAQGDEYASLQANTWKRNECFANEQQVLSAAQADHIKELRSPLPHLILLTPGEDWNGCQYFSPISLSERRIWTDSAGGLRSAAVLVPWSHEGPRHELPVKKGVVLAFFNPLKGTKNDSIRNRKHTFCEKGCICPGSSLHWHPSP